MHKPILLTVALLAPFPAFAVDNPLGENATSQPAIDQRDWEDVVNAFLTAYQEKDCETLAALGDPDDRAFWLELAEQGVKHPRYDSIFSGWRMDAVERWSGKWNAPRYDGADTDAYVRFEDNGEEAYCLVMRTDDDDMWYVVDIHSPNIEDWEAMSTERPE